MGRKSIDVMLMLFIQSYILFEPCAVNFFGLACFLRGLFGMFNLGHYLVDTFRQLTAQPRQLS